MGHISDLIASDIDAGLLQQPHKSLLRLFLFGSVDDGKSTLIGRILCDSKRPTQDQLAAVESDFRKWGTQGGAIDFEPLAGGLAAEREPGIATDDGYRCFSTGRRQYIVADAPGQEQYTRSMASGASAPSVAVILVDASEGVLTQTRRLSYLVSLIGIRQVVLAINKMDLVGYDEATCRRIDAQFREFAVQIGLTDTTTIPLSGLKDDNVAERSAAMPWYDGPALMDYLESCEIDETSLQRGPLRLPVQWVTRSDLDLRGFCGRIASGQVRPGDRVRVQPLGRESVVARIVGLEGDQPLAVAGEAVTLTLRDEIDISPGDLISAADAPAEVADQFECNLVWMDHEPLLPGRAYLLKLGARRVGATVTAIKHKVNVNTLEHTATKTLALNEIGVGNLSLDRAVAFDPYAVNRDTGGFILIDRLSNRTVGTGMLHFALRRAHNIHLQALDVDKAARSALLGQKPMVLWFTGLSGAGKSSIANLVAKKLYALGRATYLLDGDNMRHGLSRDLGFTDADRVENIRRVGEVAKLMADAGLIVITAFISPFRAERDMARKLLEPGEFIEVHVDVPLEVAEARDVKGLYAKARRGELPHFTGIDSPYEVPQSPEIRLPAAEITAEQAAECVLDKLRELAVVPR